MKVAYVPEIFDKIESKWKQLFVQSCKALDSITEGRIQKTLMEMSKGKTCLIIAHRLSTVVHADKILVISNGEILESGSHLQLLKQDGNYARLWSEQTKSESTTLNTDATSWSF